MQTECSNHDFEFEGFAGRKVVGGFNGGAITSNAGALLLRQTLKATALISQAAACFTDHRQPNKTQHKLETLIGQRITGIALGYEDLNDHDALRHDPVLALLSDRLEPKRADCAALAGKSTLNRLEHAPESAPTRYNKIAHGPAKLKALFVELFLQAHAAPRKRIILVLDATDDPLHGRQEGPFFHGYYRCYC